MGSDGFADIPAGLSAQVERRIAASKDYDMLQGLVAVWCGAALVIAALTGRSSWLAILCGIGAAVGAGWYERRYGKQRFSSERTIATVAIGVAMIGAICVASGMDHWYPGPILWAPLASGLTLIVANVLGYRHIGTTVWHWVCAVTVLLCSLAPLVGWHPNRWESLMPLGIALIITGAVDHKRLVTIFGTGTADE